LSRCPSWVWSCLMMEMRRPEKLILQLEVLSFQQLWNSSSIDEDRSQV
jgi:hypothetical protein